MMKDQLSDYLENTYQYYFSNNKNSSILLWASENTENIPIVCSCIIGLSYSPLDDEKELLIRLRNKLNTLYHENPIFNRIINFGKAISKLGQTHYVVIGYPIIDEYSLNDWEESEKKYPFEKVNFFFKDFTENNSNSQILNGVELRDTLHLLLYISDYSVGTRKRKNKHISDYFQYWSRNFLAKELIKIDIDGGFFEGDHGEKILIEIKRSNKPPLNKWLPYKNDHPNYYMEYQFCNRNHMHFWLLHHDGKNEISGESEISFFNIKNVKPIEDRSSDFLQYDLPFGEINIIKLNNDSNSLDSKLMELGLNKKRDEINGKNQN